MSQPVPGTAGSGRIIGSGTTLNLGSVVAAAGDWLFVTVSNGVSGAAAVRAISSVVRNGQSFTQLIVGDDGNFCSASIWYHETPTVGSFTVTVTQSNSGQLCAGWFAVSGAVTAGSTAKADNVTGVGTVSATSSLAATLTDIVLAAFGSDSQAGITPGSGATQLWEEENVETDTSGGAEWYAGAGASVTAQYQTVSGTDGGGLAAVLIQGSAVQIRLPRPIPHSQRA